MDYKLGFELSLENSRNLLHIASVAASEKRFGIACSLNILAAEEAMKASFLSMKHHSPNNQFDDFDKIFSSHKTKHARLKILVENHETIYIDVLKSMDNLYKIMFEIFELLSTYVQVGVNINIPELRENKNWLEIQIQNQLNNNEHKETIKWLEKANEEKKKGLYVDCDVNNAWNDPQSFSQSQFDAEKKRTEMILEFVVRTEALLSLNFETKSSVG